MLSEVPVILKIKSIDIFVSNKRGPKTSVLSLGYAYAYKSI